jgi:hypothetical protein
MARTKAQKAGDKKRSWKLKRRKKYDKKGQKSPKAGARGKYWVPAYKKADGTRVKGHWRVNHHKK